MKARRGFAPAGFSCVGWRYLVGLFVCVRAVHAARDKSGGISNAPVVVEGSINGNRYVGAVKDNPCSVVTLKSGKFIELFCNLLLTFGKKIFDRLEKEKRARPKRPRYYLRPPPTAVITSSPPLSRRFPLRRRRPTGIP